MQIQNLLFGASLSALLAVNATGNAAENTVQNVPERNAAENTARAGEAKGERGQQSAKLHKAKNADNTKVNTRDRKDTLTPMDQSNGEAEIAITANIRKGIMGDKTVSFDGKNVKIVTVGTKVTLRGPVKSSKEKAAIDDIAKRTAGVSEVDNQLEVIN